MATLHALPTADPPLVGRPMAAGGDNGPAFVDAETVERFGEQITHGVITFTVNPDELLAAISQEELDAIFTRYLNASPLSAGFILTRRVYALHQTVQYLIDQADDGLTARGNPAPPTRAQLEISSANLEVWLLQASQSEALEKFTPEQREFMAREIAMLDPKSLAALTTVSLSQLQQWRTSHVGPPFVKTGVKAASIRYPVAGVLAWIYALAQK